MDAPPAFSDRIREIANGLREDGRSHVHLNRAASGIDHLGRKLAGLGFVRDREIGGCFNEALRELETSHGLRDEKRADAVQRAAAQLDAAAAHSEAGFAPAS
ncbi:MAG TPA: hypothetical protein VK399_15325 [Longimicrobiaceae bacterium]|nr:hypothetical protein [Longimicrobiaceae bacterium]